MIGLRQSISALFTGFSSVGFAIAMAAAPAYAQTTATAINPITVQRDINNVDLGSGLIRVDVPSLSIPAAPRLKFTSLQQIVPSLNVVITNQANDDFRSSITVETGASTSERFDCTFFNVCKPKRNGATIDGTFQDVGPYTFTESGSAAVYNFSSLQYKIENTSGKNEAYYYATSIQYPDGEKIEISYNIVPATRNGIPQNNHRPSIVSSNTGYYISFSYRSNSITNSGWFILSQATLYKTGVATPLARLTYGTNGTITDLANRIYTCTGCRNGIRAPANWSSVTMKLPDESANQIVVSSQAVPNSSNTNVVKSVVRDGVTWNYSYNFNKPGTPPYNSVTVTGPNSYSMTYQMATLDGQNRPKIASATDAIGRMTFYSYNIDTGGESLVPTQIKFPEGNCVNVKYDDYGNIVSKVAYPKGSLCPATIAGLPIPAAAIVEAATIDIAACAPGSVHCYRPVTYTDSLDRTTEYKYDGAGRLVRKTEPANSSGISRVTTLIYDLSSSYSAPTVVRTCEKLQSDTIKDCGTTAPIQTEYTYFGKTSLPTSKKEIDTATGASLTTTYTYNDAGYLLSEDGPLPGTGDTKYYRYDAVGRRTWEISPAGASGLRLATRTSYRASDNKPTLVESGTVPNAVPAPTDPDPVLTVATQQSIVYDARRNPITTAMASGGVTYNVQSTLYDERGQLVCSTVRMNPAAFGSLPASACTLGTQGTQGPDRITRNIYDNAGQLTQIQKGVGTPLQQNYASYRYTDNGKRDRVTDANNNRADLRYDGHHRLERWVFPSKTVAGQVNEADYEAYGYDEAGNRTSLRKRDGVTLTYEYDDLNRVTQKVVPTSASGAAGYTVNYSYNLRDAMRGAYWPNGFGVSLDYDGFGRLNRQDDSTTDSTRPQGWDRGPRYTTYDEAGRKTVLTVGWINTRYQYDNLDRVTRVTNNTGVDHASFTYDNLGRRTAISRGTSPAVTGYTYDAVNRLTGITHNLDGAATTNDVTISFPSYNPASQITSQSTSNDIYAFTERETVTRSYVANGLNQYTSAGPATFTYDANGNLTSDGSVNYVYDAENRLVATSGAKVASLLYDPLGRLVRIRDGNPANARWFIYDEDDLVAEYGTNMDNSPKMLKRYIHGPGADEPLAWFDLSSDAPANRHDMMVDSRGSIVAITNGNGTTEAINRYDEYGRPQTGNAGLFQYTGQAWLPEVGLYHYKARVYSPQLGRFLQTDPVGYEDQTNLYAYVANDPINGTDPTGQFKCVDNGDGSATCTATDALDSLAMRVYAAAVRAGIVAHPAAQPSNSPSTSSSGENSGGKDVPASNRQVGSDDNGGPPLNDPPPPPRLPAPPALWNGDGYNTGRYTPENLTEQTAMQEARSNPAAGRQLPISMSDKQFPPGSVKMAQNINGVEIHYVKTPSGYYTDFKFK